MDSVLGNLKMTVSQWNCSISGQSHHHIWWIAAISCTERFIASQCFSIVWNCFEKVNDIYSSCVKNEWLWLKYSQVMSPFWDHLWMTQFRAISASKGEYWSVSQTICTICEQEMLCEFSVLYRSRCETSANCWHSCLSKVPLQLRNYDIWSHTAY